MTDIGVCPTGKCGKMVQEAIVMIENGLAMVSASIINIVEQMWWNGRRGCEIPICASSASDMICSPTNHVFKGMSFFSSTE